MSRPLLSDQSDAEACGRMMVGSGADSYDPLCGLRAGHDGPCRSPSAIDQRYGSGVGPLRHREQARRDVLLAMSREEAHAVWNSIGIAVQLLDEVGAEPNAPLYGQGDRLIGVAQRLDHEINHA